MFDLGCTIPIFGCHDPSSTSTFYLVHLNNIEDLTSKAKRGKTFYFDSNQFVGIVGKV